MAGSVNQKNWFLIWVKAQTRRIHEDLDSKEESPSQPSVIIPPVPLTQTNLKKTAP